MNIFAHRGLSAYYPENTMLSFKKCLGLDIYGIELDVQKTKDDKMVVIHDEKVDRIYLGHGYVKDFTLKELSLLKCRKYGFEDRTDCKIPTLEEVLTLLKPTDFIINIELKNSVIKYKNLEQDVLELVKKLNLERRIIISSFNLKSIKKCHKINPKIKTSFLVNKLGYKLRFKTHIFNKIKKYNCVAIHPNVELVNKKFIRMAHINDLKVNPYTIDNIDTMKELSQLKADGIFTNYANIFSSIKNKP